MRTVYFDTSIFLAIFNGESAARDIGQLLRELKKERTRIYTSIVTVQEVSVAAYRHGGSGDDNHTKVSKLARVAGITKDVALTAAKLEAHLTDLGHSSRDREQAKENRRRKWDCFHVATALDRNCDILYALDEKMLNKKQHLDVGRMQLLKPKPKQAALDM